MRRSLLRTICAFALGLLASGATPAASLPSPSQVLSWDEATLYHEAQHLPIDLAAIWLKHNDPMHRWAGARLASVLRPEDIPWNRLLHVAAQPDPVVSMEAAWALCHAARRLAEAPGTAALDEEEAVDTSRLRAELQRTARRHGIPLVRRWLGYAAASLSLRLPTPHQ